MTLSVDLTRSSPDIETINSLNFHPTNQVSRVFKASLDLNILSSGSIATTPALSLEEEDYDWGKIGIS